jgi:hypothetical protein
MKPHENDVHEAALRLITVDDSVLVLIDFTTGLLDTVKSHPREVLVNNATALAKQEKPILRAGCGKA